jgi:SnoaL-like protein
MVDRARLATSLEPDHVATDEQLVRLLARHEIEQVLYRYCRGVDRADWDLMLSAFHPDAIDEHGSVNGSAADLVEWTRKRHEQVVQSMHLLSNIGFLAQTADHVWTEAYCAVRQRHVRPGKSDVDLSIGVRYIDVFELRAEWRIIRRRTRYDWVRRLTGEKDLLATSPELERSARDQSDPVWDFLSQLG